MLERTADGRRHILGVHYTQDEKEKKTSVAFWLDECKGKLHTRSCHSNTTNERTWPKTANRKTEDVVKDICRNIVGEEEQTRSEDCPWKRYEDYLPKIICDPDARTQVLEYFRKGGGKDVAEREKVIGVAQNILQTAGFPYYRIQEESSHAIRQQEGSSVTIKQQEGSSVTIMQQEGSSVTIMQQEGSSVTIMQQEGSSVTIMQPEGSSVTIKQQEGFVRHNHRKKHTNRGNSFLCSTCPEVISTC